MAIATEYIKKLITEDYKDCCVLITCDNEHLFYHNSKNQPPLIWDWENELFIAFQTNREIDCQQPNPIEVTYVSFGEIQFIHAYLDTASALEFIKENITDEGYKEQYMDFIKRTKPAMMNDSSLRTPYKYASDVKYVK